VSIDESSVLIRRSRNQYLSINACEVVPSII
jgi:hypothetical protein